MIIGHQFQSRVSPIAPLLLDCGFLHKLTKIFNVDPPDSSIIEAGIQCLSGIVIEDTTIIQAVIENHFLEQAANFLKNDSLQVTTQKV